MRDEPVFTKVLQVAVVVKDIAASVRRYADEYGIGPWEIYELNPDTVENMTIHGQPQKYAMKIALASIGEVEIELIEPLCDKSIYAEFLREHGEGIHHLACDVKDYDGTKAFFKKKGNQILQEGTWNGETFTYFDNKQDLGLITEIYKRPAEFEVPEPDSRYPE